MAGKQRRAPQRSEPQKASEKPKSEPQKAPEWMVPTDDGPKPESELGRKDT